MTNDTEEIVYREKVRQLYSLLPAGLIANVINCLIVAFFHLRIVPFSYLLLWVSLLVSLNIVRFIFYLFYRFYSVSIVNYHYWGNFAKIGIFLSGITWGLAAFLSLFHESDPHKLLVAYVLGGMSAGTAGMFSAFRFNYYGFAIPAIFPLIIIFLIDGSPIMKAMAGMLGLFAALLSVTAEFNRNVVDRLFHLSLEKDALLENLSAEKENAEKLNVILQEEVSQRIKTEDDLVTARNELESRVIERTKELKDANVEIQRSEETYRSIVETSQEGIWVINSNCSISYVNSRMAMMLGYTISEMMNLGIEHFVDDNYLHKYELKNIKNEIRQINLRRKDRSLITVLESVSGLPIPIGNNGKILGMVTDITDLKKHEEEIRRYANTLKEKNDELDSFSHSVSHDLRNPILTTMGFAQFLSEDYSDKLDDSAKELLLRIIDNTQRMNLIINDLLRLSKLSQQEIKKEKISMSDLAKKIANELIESDKTRNVRFEIQEQVYGNADRGLMFIALGNLIGNSWKYSMKVENAEIKFGSIIKDNQNVYFVKDNGVGFDSANIDTLFKPFQRFHSQTEYAGIGIGLVIVDRVIRKHGGRVWAESKPGSGATFFFTLD
jgi:PAS domain S-box-containing protein